MKRRLARTLVIAFVVLQHPSTAEEVAHAAPSEAYSVTSDSGLVVGLAALGLTDLGFNALTDGYALKGSRGTDEAVQRPGTFLLEPSEDAYGSSSAQPEEAEASPSPSESPAPESEITPDHFGGDDRVRVTDTKKWAARAVVWVDGCSGWLNDETTVITAGHCLYDNGVWDNFTSVVPARNGTTWPYSSCGVREKWVMTRWHKYRDKEYDLGAVILTCNIGARVGYFGVRVFPYGYDMTQLPTRVLGYPEDKTFATMWKADGYIYSNSNRLIYYTNDVVGGNSGSPVYWPFSGCGVCAMGLHARHIGTVDHEGTRIHLEIAKALGFFRSRA